MRKLVSVELKEGGKIAVLDDEIAGLKNAGLIKEDKQAAQTKEHKDSGDTKADPKEAMEKMAPSKKRPVDIGSGSVKGSSAKKT